MASMIIKYIFVLYARDRYNHFYQNVLVEDGRIFEWNRD